MNTNITSLKQKNYRLLIYIGALIVINLIVSFLIKTGQAVHLDGHLATDNDIKRSTLATILFVFPLWGFILGSLISFIPYKKLSYRKKYLYFSLMTIIVLELIILILAIRNLILS